MKSKIESIEALEDRLLAGSTIDDIQVGKIVDNAEQDNGLRLSADQVRTDVSIIARIFIKAYCGWPFHNNILKRKILKNLLKIQNNATDMSALAFFNLLKPIVEIIPDNHITLWHNGNLAKTLLAHKNKFVGKNLATRQEKLKIEKRGDLTIVAISTLDGWDKNAEMI